MPRTRQPADLDDFSFHLSFHDDGFDWILGLDIELAFSTGKWALIQVDRG